MATSSITKDFYVKDQEAFERLKIDLETQLELDRAAGLQPLKRSRNKLATFVFR